MSRKRYPGKFEGCGDDRLAELLYSIVQNGGIDKECGDCQEIGEWYGLIIQRKHAYIVSEDSQGFFDYTYFNTIDEAETKFNNIESDLQELTGPQEEDITIASNGFKHSVGIVNGEFIGEYTEYQDAENAVKDWMTENQFFPNVWNISDHGNATLLNITVE